MHSGLTWFLINNPRWDLVTVSVSAVNFLVKHFAIWKAVSTQGSKTEGLGKAEVFFVVVVVAFLNHGYSFSRVLSVAEVIMLHQALALFDLSVYKCMY